MPDIHDTWRSEPVLPLFPSSSCFLTRAKSEIELRRTTDDEDYAINHEDLRLDCDSWCSEFWLFSPEFLLVLCLQTGQKRALGRQSTVD